MIEKTLADWGERGWIEKIRSCAEQGFRSSLPVPIGDDAAVWSPPPGKHLVLTCDAQIEGTHFRSECLDWKGLARRALLAAASDVTAMGGAPTGFLVSLGVPSSTLIPDLEFFAQGLTTVCHEFSLILFGGDTVRCDRVYVDVTCLGMVDPGEAIRLTGARPGDSLWVTGCLGGMQAAWRAQDDPRPEEAELRNRFWNPPARWSLLRSLRDQLEICALTDLSDGLRIDLGKILDPSHLGAEIHLESLPVDPLAREFAQARNLDPLSLAYNGGEDFELLIVASEDSDLEGRLDCEGTPVTRIGRVLASPPGATTLLNGAAFEVETASFEHF